MENIKLAIHKPPSSLTYSAALIFHSVIDIF